MNYTIKQVLEMTGLSIPTLRYYDQEGLLPTLTYKKSGYRVFHEMDIEILRIIECFKKTGMQLKDIKKYMDLFLKGESTLEERHQMFEKQKELLLQKRKEIDEALMETENRLTQCRESMQKGSEHEIREKARRLYEMKQEDVKTIKED